MFSKKVTDPQSLLENLLKNETTIMSGGFGLCGIPENSIDYISQLNIKGLTVISNNIGNSGRGLVKLLKI